jgi:UDP-2,4-diacetamido-2,4,6-trideoxy-beta-L-altropyranose hydrolase
MKTLAIRADALPATGLGHLTRCLALAHAARAAGWRVHGIGCISDPVVRTRTRQTLEAWHDCPASHPDPADLPASLTALEHIAPDWIVLDGYSFDTDYQRALRSRARLLVLDDGPRLDAYSADLLLDQNLGAETRRYPFEGGGRALLGSAYVLLRPAFLAWRNTSRTTPAQARRLLVTLGGTVEAHALQAVLAGLAQVTRPLEITVLTGTDPAKAELARSLAPPGHRMILLPWHDDMPGLMTESDLALSAAGSTAWELAFMGVPALYAVLADNQADIATALQMAGAGINLGECDAGFATRLASELTTLLDAAPRRADFSRAARVLVDGYGAERVIEEMQCR